jgi:choline transport protein
MGRLTSLDATAHMTEEMKDARKDAPKAIIWAVWIGAITGFIFLVAVCFCIVDIDAAASSPTGVPIFQIFESSTRSFARDGGLPFSGFFSKVNHQSHVPVNAICLVVVINMALMSIYFGSVTGFSTILAISTEGFCKCFNVPYTTQLLIMFRPILHNAVGSPSMGPLVRQRS